MQVTVAALQMKCSEREDVNLDRAAGLVREAARAGANLTPVVAANRVGSESGPHGVTHFWGRSFITDERGAIVAKASDRDEFITATFDLSEIRRRRANWGVFRDRRPDLYQPLLTLDGRTDAPDEGEELK